MLFLRLKRNPSTSTWMALAHQLKWPMGGWKWDGRFFLKGATSITLLRHMSPSPAVSCTISAREKTSFSLKPGWIRQESWQETLSSLWHSITHHNAMLMELHVLGASLTKDMANNFPVRRPRIWTATSSGSAGAERKQKHFSGEVEESYCLYLNFSYVPCFESSQARV